MSPKNMENQSHVGILFALTIMKTRYMHVMPKNTSPIDARFVAALCFASEVPKIITFFRDSLEKFMLRNNVSKLKNPVNITLLCRLKILRHWLFDYAVYPRNDRNPKKILVLTKKASLLNLPLMTNFWQHALQILGKFLQWV